jgi:hypothetical protein
MLGRLYRQAFRCNYTSTTQWFRLALVAAAVAAVLVAGARGRRRSWLVAAGVVSIGCLPFALETIRVYALRAHEKLWIAFGRDDLAFLYSEREAASPSPLLAYYGPVGFTPVLAGLVATAVVWRRGAVPHVTLVLAAAPVAMVLLLALAVSWDPLRARFLVYGLALAAATWGLVVRYRWLAWGTASMAAVTIGLTFVHSVEKPAGVVIFDERTSTGVWGLPPRGRSDVAAPRRRQGDGGLLRGTARNREGRPSAS